MKIKWAWLSILFVILALNVNTIYAKEDLKAVYVEENNMKISFPESCYVLTSEVSGDEPYLELLGADPEQVMEYYRENNIFIHAVGKELDFEIVCTVKSNDNQQFLTDLSIVSDEEIRNLANTIEATYRDYGYEGITSDCYNARHEKFALIRFNTTSEDRKVCCEQYFFLLNDKAYYFTLRVFGDSISSNLDSMMKDIVDSIYFFRNTGIMQYVYENAAYGISFEVPKEWDEKMHDNTNPYLITQFAHANLLGETFQVYAYDVWSDFDIVRKIMTTRDKLSTIGGMEQIENNKNYLETFYKDFSSVKIRKGKFIPLIYEEKPTLLEHEKIDGNYYQNNYCVLKDGVLYVFQYGYYEGMDMHRTDIESVLDSLRIINPGMFEKDELVYKEIARFTAIFLTIIVGIILAFVLLIYMYFKSQNPKKSDD